MEPRAKTEKTNIKRKIVAAAALLVIFATVLFAIPSERLAWQGPYVMGTLLLPKPSPGPYVRADILRESADSSFSFLGFVSVAGILVLLAGRLSGFPHAQRIDSPDHGLRLPAEDKITIMYIL